MRMCLKSMSAKAALWTCLFGVIAAPGFVQAEEGNCPGQAAAEAADRAIPFFSRLPGMSRLFQNPGQCTEAGCPQEIERIGVDFDFCLDGNCPLGLWTVSKCRECGAAKATAACLAADGKSCPDGECRENATACKAGCPGACNANARYVEVICTKAGCKTAACAESCGANCCCAEKCAANKCCAENCPAKACSTECEAKCGEAKCPAAECFAGRPVGHQPPELWEQIVELVGANAGLAATLEARDERDELIDQLVELSTENARLESRVELAEAKFELMQQMVQLARENQQLKSQVTELAHQLKTQEAAERTAERLPSAKSATKAAR